MHAYILNCKYCEFDYRGDVSVNNKHRVFVSLSHFRYFRTKRFMCVCPFNNKVL